MLKHGFLILAHSNFGLLERIISLLSKENHYFFINIDKKSEGCDNFIDLCKKKFKNIYFLEGKEQLKVNHAGFSMVKAEIKLLEKAHEKEMDYVHLISGQDFPVKSNYEFDLFFENNLGKSFMHFDSLEEGKIWSKNKYPERIKFFYFMDFPFRNHKLGDFIYRALTKISKKLPIRKDIPGLWAGWQWFSWHKTVTEYVLNQVKINKKYFRRFRFTSCADELVFVTLLKPFAESLNIDINNSLRYIDWHSDRPGRSTNGIKPLILNEEDYEAINKSGNFFCRKVDTIISKTLIETLSKDIILKQQN